MGREKTGEGMGWKVSERESEVRLQGRRRGKRGKGWSRERRMGGRGGGSGKEGGEERMREVGEGKERGRE